MNGGGSNGHMTGVKRAAVSVSPARVRTATSATEEAGEDEADRLEPNEYDPPQ